MADERDHRSATLGAQSRGVVSWARRSEEVARGCDTEKRALHVRDRDGRFEPAEVGLAVECLDGPAREELGPTMLRGENGLRV